MHPTFNLLLNPVFIFILLLATWRVSSLMNNERGFLNIFTIIRHIFGVRYITYERVNEEKIAEKYLTLKEVIELGEDALTLQAEYKWHISELFSCIWCMSVWVGFMLTFLFVLYPVIIVFYVSLAVSTGAIFIEILRERLTE